MFCLFIWFLLLPRMAEARYQLTVLVIGDAKSFVFGRAVVQPVVCRAIRLDVVTEGGQLIGRASLPVIR
jgi:hypothetical protein